MMLEQHDPTTQRPSHHPPFVGPARKYVTIPGWPHQFQRHVRIFGSANKDVHPATVRVENLQQDFLGGAKGAVGKELANGRWVHLAIRSMVLEYLPTFTP